MKTLTIASLLAVLAASPTIAQTQTFSVTGDPRNPTVIPLGTPDYSGPSRLTNPKLRNYFGASGATIDPALAAELDARFANAGSLHSSRGKTYFKSGEFSGKTLQEAVAIVSAQFQQAQQQRGPSTYRSALDANGANARFFEEKRAQQAPAISQPPVASPSSDEVTAWQAKAVARYPDLAVAGSPFHSQFSARYQELRRTRPEFFTDPRWPLLIAQEIDARAR